MLYIGRFSVFQPRNILQFARAMSRFSVKCVDNDERLQITFDYGHRGGISRTFNSNRPKVEEIGNTLARLAANVDKHIKKKKKKKPKNEDDTEDALKVRVLLANGETECENTVLAKDALEHGNIILIDDQTYTVDVNTPCCLAIAIPDSIMVGFPLFPKLDLEFSDLNDCEFVWTKVKYEEEDNSSQDKAKKQKCKNGNETDSIKVVDSQNICTEYSYTPTNDDIGYKLRVTCTPKSGQRVGKVISAESKYEVTSGPGFCPFENRQQYTQKMTGKDELRVVSYNILADLYADQEYSRDVLYPYCPPYALAIDYRKHVIIKELQGYNSDVICLQEVDSKVFNGDLSIAMDALGFGGSMKEKVGEVREGSAIFYRRSKFRLIEEYGESLRDILETNRVCQDLVKKTYAVPDLKQKLETRTTVLHILVLEPVDDPGRVILLANTHLYFHPDAGHIRMVQVLTAMRFIDTLRQKYSKQNPCMIFCGDFNSTPHRAIYEFMTTKCVKEDNIDWNDGGPDQFVEGMNFSHNHNIDSGCGKVQYTNYTSGFNGHLDYIFYDCDHLEVVQSIPPPDHRDVELHTALPSIVFPSDHIAQICDFKWKNN